MQISSLDFLRCPYCGGHLELVTSMFNRTGRGSIQDGILGCHCCIFPVVDGIPVLHLQPAAVAARGHIEAEHPDQARRAMFGIESAEAAGPFEQRAVAPGSTYRDLVEALGPGFEGGYFLYRFSDPTFVVADAIVRTVAKLAASGRRVIDVCGGSGHLTRSLMAVAPQASVLADLYYAKVWLARRFTAPGCEAVCCDANAPLPFARGAFGFAMCSDAFQYIWTKRQFVGELIRLIDDRGAMVISHTHNALAWSPSHGQPLDPAGYRQLFEGIEPRIFGEAGLFGDVVRGGPLDLSRIDSSEALENDPALTIAAARQPGIFAVHPLPPPNDLDGELRVNPLYRRHADGERVHLTIEFPSPDYEEEFGACRQYLPDTVTVSAAALKALDEGRRPAELDDLVRRRVIISLPKLYY
jgi:uncharacterized protein YbaR (Trm112 family)